MSEYADTLQNIENYREGDTETLSTFLPPFKFFRVDMLLWYSSLPPRLSTIFRSRACAETFGPFLQLCLWLQYEMSAPSKVRLG